MYTDRASRKTNLLFTTYKLWYYLHVSWYRIPYTRWTPGKFSSLHQRMVTWPWLRQSFSLPQCSVQHCLPLPSTHSPPFPMQNMLAADIFTQKKNGPSCGLSLKLFHPYFSYWIVALSSSSKMYISFFSFLPVEVSKQSEFQRNAKPPLELFFLFFLQDRKFHGTGNIIHISKHISETYKTVLLLGISAILLISLFKERNMGRLYLYYTNWQTKIQMNPLQNKVTVARFIIYFSSQN